jgi:hypothetical protein
MCAWVFLFAGAATVTCANAATITFEGVASAGGYVIPATPYYEAGFEITASAPYTGIYDAASATNTNGTSIFGWCSNLANCGGSTIVITLAAVGGGAFSFTSMDIGNLLTPSFYGFNAIELLGHLVGGGTVSSSLSTFDNWRTVSYFAPDFANLVSIDFWAVYDSNFCESSEVCTYDTPFPAFDNLVLTAVPSDVPLPATLPLLATGLGALGLPLWRRKRKAQAVIAA